MNKPIHNHPQAAELHSPYPKIICQPLRSCLCIASCFDLTSYKAMMNRPSSMSRHLSPTVTATEVQRASEYIMDTRAQYRIGEATNLGRGRLSRNCRPLSDMSRQLRESEAPHPSKNVNRLLLHAPFIAYHCMQFTLSLYLCTS